MANDLGTGRTAGFAGKQDADAKTGQLLRQECRLRRLAGAFAAFERDEFSGHLALLCRVALSTKVGLARLWCFRDVEIGNSRFRSRAPAPLISSSAPFETSR